MEYRDFDLRIEALTAEGYSLRATSKPHGEAKSHMNLDSTFPTIQDYLQKLEDRKTHEAFLIEFGTFLYNSLFTGDVESLFQQSVGAISGQEELGLRIRLRVDPPEISALPWEYIYSPKQKYFLGASKKTPLTRYLEVFQSIQGLRTRLPIGVLVAIPGGSGQDVQAEKDILTEALGKLGDAVRWPPKWLENKVTRSTVADALLEQRYDIFHFIGHGEFKGGQGHLVFNDEDSGKDLISDDIFARFFLDYPSMKLVVLNACQGATVSSSQPMVGMAPKLVERGIPAVIAHQYPVLDDAAICFAREFYRSLCVGTEAGQVDAAMAHARNQLSIRFSAERSLGVPVLFMRASTGLIFDLEAARRRNLEKELSRHNNNLQIVEKQIELWHEYLSKASLKDEEDENDEIRKIRKDHGLALKRRREDEIAAVQGIREKLGLA